MKALCLCWGGNVRSVTARSVLLTLGKADDAISAGLGNNKTETIKLLCEWADKIYLCGEENFRQFMPSGFENKIIVLPFGGDRWGVPFGQELTEIITKELERLNI